MDNSNRLVQLYELGKPSPKLYIKPGGQSSAVIL
jgi:hypothetical protein